MNIHDTEGFGARIESAITSAIAGGRLSWAGSAGMIGAKGMFGQLAGLVTGGFCPATVPRVMQDRALRDQGLRLRLIGSHHTSDA